MFFTSTWHFYVQNLLFRGKWIRWTNFYVSENYLTAFRREVWWRFPQTNLLWKVHKRFENIFKCRVASSTIEHVPDREIFGCDADSWWWGDQGSQDSSGSGIGTYERHVNRSVTSNLQWVIYRFLKLIKRVTNICRTLARVITFDNQNDGLEKGRAARVLPLDLRACHAGLVDTNEATYSAHPRCFSSLHERVFLPSGSSDHRADTHVSV